MLVLSALEVLFRRQTDVVRGPDHVGERKGEVTTHIREPRVLCLPVMPRRHSLGLGAGEAVPDERELPGERIKRRARGVACVN